MQRIDLGTARIEPTDPVVAGSYVTLRYAYIAGHPIDDTGYLKIVFRFAGDFGQPQFGDPAGANYCRVETTGDCRIEARWDPKGHTRPWGRSVYLKVTGGYLDTGEQIVITFGDRSGGSPGWRMQTFCESSFEFKTLVDPIATYEFKELPRSPVVCIVPGEPIRAVCIAPSQVNVGQPFTYYLKLEDRWGNPTGRPHACRHAGLDEAGVQTVSARDSLTGLWAESNPIEVFRKPQRVRRYWADLHGQSEETIGTNSIDAYYTFARDYGLLDISSHQGNDFQVTDAFWAEIKRVADAFNVPGAFVTFPGYEWSGNTPLGGDRNVYLAHGGEIVHSCADLLPGKTLSYPIAATAEGLFRELRQQEGAGAFAFAHVGGRYADLSVHDPEIELAVEVHSAWGTFEWLVEEALERGYRMGICANSDGHKGRPGASYPGASKFGSYGGLTCVLAEALDRDAIYWALRARHFYATTGHRPLLDVRMRWLDREVEMGDIIAGSTDAVLDVSVVGTAPIERVDVRNGTTLVRTLRPFGSEEGGSRIKVVWSGAKVRGRARMVDWRGTLDVDGNTIQEVIPVNFWSPERPVCRQGNRVAWRSVTTGGVAGLILQLDRPDAGTLHVRTAQGDVDVPIAEVAVEPRAWRYGGVDKRLEVYRLPDRSPGRAFSFSLPLVALRSGDNPIYVRVIQEDGHMAWSSPIYWVVEERCEAT